jgi:hypothetical protein
MPPHRQIPPRQVVKLAPHTVISFIILDNLSKQLLGREAL